MVEVEEEIKRKKEREKKLKQYQHLDTCKFPPCTIITTPPPPVCFTYTLSCLPSPFPLRFPSLLPFPLLVSYTLTSHFPAHPSPLSILPPSYPGLLTPLSTPSLFTFPSHTHHASYQHHFYHLTPRSSLHPSPLHRCCLLPFTSPAP